MGEQRDIVIIGGSAAGLAAAAAIAEADHRGATVLISAEDRLPYKRTKVSKSFAKGFARDDFAIHEPGWYEQAGIELCTGTTVTDIDLDGRSVTLADGSARHFDELIVATGARPRQLPVAPAARDRVFFAHDIAQVEALRRCAASHEEALVIGLGVLGTEVAEQLHRMGKRVTMVGDTDQVMAQYLNQSASRRLAEVLAAQGVRLRFRETVGKIDRQGERISVDLQAARQQLDCDLVVCCIGLEARSELARKAGLTTRRGIVVDSQLRASHPQVLAAGDVAEHSGGRLTHLWRHALDQGRVAGINAAGGAATYEIVPFRVKCTIFDQYFFALQRPGPAELDQLEVVEDSSDGRYRCCYYRDGRLTGLIMVNDGARQRQYNQAVVEGWDRSTVERAFR